MGEVKKETSAGTEVAKIESLHEVREVKTVFGDKAVNQFLDQEWTLLRIDSYEPRLGCRYVIGRK